jgi:hypothetical protein
MSKKISITLDEEVLEFVDRLGNNRSGSINEILAREKQRVLMQELATAYQQQDNDPEFRSEQQTWDMTVGDGLNA